MKKFIKVLSIVMLILNIGVLAVSILSLVQPEAMGEWIVRVYEDITSDIGHTVEGMYARLTLIAAISSCVALGLTTALCETSCVYICKHVKDEEPEEVEPEQPKEEVVKEKKAKKVKVKIAEEVDPNKGSAAEVNKTEEGVVLSLKVKQSHAEQFLANLKNKK